MCSLHSEKIYCNSITIRSSKSKEIHLSHYRMKIVEQRWEEEKINVNETNIIKSKISMEPMEAISTSSFLKTLDSMKIPLIGSGGAVILIIVLMIAVKLSRDKANIGLSIIVKNSASASNTAPTCPPPTETYLISGTTRCDIPPPMEYTSLSKQIRHSGE